MHHQNARGLSHAQLHDLYYFCCSKRTLLCQPATPCPQNLPRVSHQGQQPLQAKTGAILLLKNPLLNAQFQLQHLLTVSQSRTSAEVSSPLINRRQLKKPLQPPLWNSRPVSDATEAVVKQTAKLFQSSFLSEDEENNPWMFILILCTYNNRSTKRELLILGFEMIFSNKQINKCCLFSKNIKIADICC